MYLGEITRNILMALVDAAVVGVGGKGRRGPLLFGGRATEVVNVQWGLDTSVMSAVEEAWEGPDARGVVAAGPGDDVPRFQDFDAEKLTPGCAERLERIRKVVVEKLGYKAEEVSLRDAAVRVLQLSCSRNL